MEKVWLKVVPMQKVWLVVPRSRSKIQVQVAVQVGLVVVEVVVVEVYRHHAPPRPREPSSSSLGPILSGRACDLGFFRGLGLSSNHGIHHPIHSWSSGPQVAQKPAVT